MRAGRACQHFAPQATGLVSKQAFIHKPVELAGLRPEMAGPVGVPGRQPDIVMRFGHGAGGVIFGLMLMGPNVSGVRHTALLDGRAGLHGDHGDDSAARETPLWEA